MTSTEQDMEENATIDLCEVWQNTSSAYKASAKQGMEERAAFEKWIKPKGVELHGAINEWTKKWRYAHSHVDAMWEGFQAGRATNTQPPNTDKNQPDIIEGGGVRGPSFLIRPGEPFPQNQPENVGRLRNDIARAFICQYRGLRPEHVSEADIELFLTPTNSQTDAAGKALKAALAALQATETNKGIK